MKRRDHMQSAFCGKPPRMFTRFLKVAAVFDQFDAERAHCRILFKTVAVRHDNRCGNPVAARGKPDRLAMVAARGADDAGGARAAREQFVKVNQSPAHFECAGRREIFMLDPNFGGKFDAQQRPGELRCRLERFIHDRCRALERFEREIRFCRALVRH